MTQLMQVMVLIVTLSASFVIGAYLLGKLRICFVIPKEGTAVAIMRSGGGFDHLIIKWAGHYLNDPRQSWYNPAVQAWEVMRVPQNTHIPSMYHFRDYWLAPLWRLLEHFGICWYGFYPLKQVYEYDFEWTEPRIKEGSSDYEPWHRTERTWFIFLKRFPYWIHLSAAKDADNLPLNLDYLETVEVNNPYKALFGTEDWLSRITADSNNRAKTLTGASTYEILNKERAGIDATVNDFSRAVLEIRDNVLTEDSQGQRIGTTLSYGVTPVAVALNDVTLAGTNAEELNKATTAKIVAKKNAEAKVETAEGDAKAVRIAADAEKYAVSTVYTEIGKYGAEGLAIRQLQAIEKSSAGPGNSIIWANNPILDAVKEGLKAFGVNTKPPAPPAPTP